MKKTLELKKINPRKESELLQIASVLCVNGRRNRNCRKLFSN
jgi:hypothetical protein